MTGACDEGVGKPCIGPAASLGAVSGPALSGIRRTTHAIAADYPAGDGNP